MSLKDDVKKKVPARVQQTKEYTSFLALLRKHKFSSSRALRMFLDVEIAECRAWMNANKNVPSGSRQRVQCAHHLAFYCCIKEKILPHLV